MIISDWIHAIAGFFILLSLSFGVEMSPLFHSVYWLVFTAFVGLNLFQFGFTKFCPLGLILKKLGVPAHRIATRPAPAISINQQ
jgi:hypothetical protein